MAEEVAIQSGSWTLVRDEINLALEQCEAAFETFLGDVQDTAPLTTVAQTFDQLRGTFRLIELPGADVLAAELSALVDALRRGEKSPSEELITAISRGMMTLQRYLEGLSQRPSVITGVLLESINELRLRQGVPLLPEAAFYSGPLGGKAALPTDGAAADPEQRKPLVHMYRTGLLGVLRDGGETGYALMLRALDRLTGMDGEGELPWLAAAVLEALQSDELPLTLGRKRLLGSIERHLAATKPLPEAMSRDLRYLVAISGEGERVVKAKALFQLPVIDINAARLKREQQKIQGPSRETIVSMVEMLRDELRGAKEMLEVASQGAAAEEGIRSITPNLKRVSDILDLLEIPGAASTLRGQIAQLDEWLQNGVSFDGDQLLTVANAILFVESVLERVRRMEGSGDEAGSTSQREALIARTELEEAEQIVLRECQAGLQLSKRAIGAYVDANYDPIQIANVAVTLSAVRGGLEVLNLQRAALVLRACVTFIHTRMQKAAAPLTQKQWLDTLADALVSLEYYVGELAANHRADEKILDVAEESLAALGMPVAALR